MGPYCGRGQGSKAQMLNAAERTGGPQRAQLSKQNLLGFLREKAIPEHPLNRCINSLDKK